MEKIFGYDWEDIRKAQQKDLSGMRKKVIHTDPPQATPKDIKLLQEKGKDWLEAKQLIGILDRLRNSGLL